MLSFALIAVQLTIVSIVDLKTRKISNRWSAVNLINAVILLLVLPEHYQLGWEMFNFPLVFFFVSFALFALKIMGAGDSKYISTFYLCVPFQEHERLFMFQLGLTIAIGIFLLAMNTVRNFDKIKLAWLIKDISVVKSIYGKSKFPYSPVILVSWILWGAFYGKELL